MRAESADAAAIRAFEALVNARAAGDRARVRAALAELRQSGFSILLTEPRGGPGGSAA